MSIKRSFIADILDSDNPMENCVVCGWIRTRRDSKGFSFIELNDGSCLANLQCIVDEGTPSFETLGDASTGASIRVVGNLVSSPGNKQKWELVVSDLVLYGLADPASYPLQKKRHSDEFLRTIAHLRSRTNKYGATWRVRSNTAHFVHKFFQSHHFYYVHPPILTASDCEGAGEMFRVSTVSKDGKLTDEFFGKPCNLTVSGQLELEALAMGVGRVYSFGPTFRAENSNTVRHAAEFWMIEPEMAFVDLDDDIAVAEELIKYVVNGVLDSCEADLRLFDTYVAPNLIFGLKNIVDQPFARISYREAVEILLKEGGKFENTPVYGGDLQSEHERFLAEQYFKRPVAVTDYPKNIKAFYMRLNDDNETVAAVDILVPRIGELVGGSQREERFDVLRNRIIENGQKLEDYSWYLDLRRFGTVPHSGFGLGFERLLMMLTGITNIRDVIQFPRTPGNIDF